MSKNKILRVGIVGCGAIGSRIAKSVTNELKNEFQISGIYDIISDKAQELEKALSLTNVVKSSLNELLNDCDLMVEATSANNTEEIILEAIKSSKHVLAMSVGKLLNSSHLFDLTNDNSQLLIPSGAVAGIDAIKSISLHEINSITLTTRKPPAGLSNNPYIKDQGIDLSNITAETVVFEGDVDTAVKFFPQNINVAATIALASNAKNKLKIRIITSPNFNTNSHEIEVTGEFGKMTSRTDNQPCPDNPKTSYLAVLSGIQTLKQFALNIKIGT